MIGFDEALALVAEAAGPLGSEHVALAEAKGRVLADPVVARVDSPPADVSAMDGYAVRDEDLPGRVALVGESLPGRAWPGALGQGQCVRIFTGAAIPEGADRVVIQEQVGREGDLAIVGEGGAARHIRTLGSDFREGDVLLEAGRVIDARALVAMAGADRATFAVHRRPRLFVLSTGDELAEPGAAHAQAGAIPESVSFGVVALAQDWGAEPVGRRRLKDELDAMEPAAAEALQAADLVVVTGGASVGERDFAKAMFEGAGLELIFAKVAIKPGKPVWLGRAAGKLVMGLPGNPTSAMVTARLLLAPLIAGLSGRAPALAWRTMALADALAATGNRETFLRARRDGETAFVLPNQDSSAQKTLAEADLLVRRAAGAPAAEAGALVDVIDF